MLAKEYVVISAGGMALRFSEKDVNKKDGEICACTCNGFNFIKLRKNDDIVFFEEIDSPQDELEISFTNREIESIFIKAMEIPLMKPKGSGIKIVRLTKKTGEVKKIVWWPGFIK